MTREELKEWIRENLLCKNGMINKYVYEKGEYENEIILFTSFLPENVRSKERVYCIVNDILEPPKCHCGTILRFIDSTRGYPGSCSVKCASSSQEMKEKRKVSRKQNSVFRMAMAQRSVNLDFVRINYTEEIKGWILKNLIRENDLKQLIYGRLKIRTPEMEEIKRITGFLFEDCTYAERILCILNDIYEIPRCKCGNLNYFKSYTKGYSKYCTQECYQEFEGRFFFQDEENKKRFKETNLRVYGYDNPAKSEQVKAKTIQTNLEIYGVPHHAQSEIAKENNRKSCKERYNVEYATQRFISNETWEVLNSKEKLQSLYDKGTTYTVAAELGVGQQCVRSYMQKHGIKARHDYDRSEAEKEILRFINLPTVKSNVREVIGRKELDIFLPEHNFAIEMNGDFYHKDKDQSYHLGKTIKCEEQGIQLFHIFWSEWVNSAKQEIWKSLINGKLGRNRLVETKDFKIVDLNEAQKFFQQNHLEGSVESKVNLGLFLEDELVSLACFSGVRLLRHCDKVGFNVRNSLPLLCAAHKKDVVYLANRRWNYFKDCESTEPGKYIDEVQHIENWDCGNWIYTWRKDCRT